VIAILTRLTLKALANFSPGFALKPWETKNAHSFIRNPEGVAIDHDQTTADPTLSGLRLLKRHPPAQGCQSSTLGWN
jgi:hypothetical protein